MRLDRAVNVKMKNWLTMYLIKKTLQALVRIQEQTRRQLPKTKTINDAVTPLRKFTRRMGIKVVGVEINPTQRNLIESPCWNAVRDACLC